MNANGDRKSIAVRTINFTNPYTNNLIVLSDIQCSLKADSGFSIHTGFNTYTYEYTEEEDVLDEEYYYSNLRFDSPKQLFEHIAYLVKDCLKSIIDKTISDGTGESIVGEEITDEIKREDIDGITYEINVQNHTINISLFNCVITGNLTLNIYSYEDDVDIANMVFNGRPSKEEPLVYTPNIKPYLNITDISVDLNNILRYGMVDSVCSTLNPYSVQNIIGSFKEHHDNLNKIFPYDRQTNFSLWFNSKDGQRVMNRSITGYIDLELIIDNTNNLNLDV